MALIKKEAVHVRGMYINGVVYEKSEYAGNEIWFRPDTGGTSYVEKSITSLKNEMNELRELIILMESFEVAGKING